MHSSGLVVSPQTAPPVHRRPRRAFAQPGIGSAPVWRWPRFAIGAAIARRRDRAPVPVRRRALHLLDLGDPQPGRGALAALRHRPHRSRGDHAAAVVPAVLAQHALGDTPELLRAPALLAGTATIPLVYVLGLRTVGRRAALVATALTAFSPFMIYYSAEARAYGLMMLLLVCSTLAMLLAIDTRRRRWWVALCGVLGGRVLLPLHVLVRARHAASVGAVGPPRAEAAGTRGERRRGAAGRSVDPRPGQRPQLADAADPLRPRPVLAARHPSRHPPLGGWIPVHVRGRPARASGHPGADPARVRRGAGPGRPGRPGRPRPRPAGFAGARARSPGSSGSTGASCCCSRWDSRPRSARSW